jgi:hypothetical protein
VSVRTGRKKTAGGVARGGRVAQGISLTSPQLVCD